MMNVPQFDPLLVAAVCGNRAELQRLLDFGEDFEEVDVMTGGTALLWAADSGHVGCVQELIRRGADVNTVNFLGLSPLRLACTRFSRNPNTYDKDASPLHMACYRGSNSHFECAELLLEAGADVHGKDSDDEDSESVMHIACYVGHIGIIRLLLQYGAILHSTMDAPPPTVRRNHQMLSAHFFIESIRSPLQSFFCRHTSVEQRQSMHQILTELQHPCQSFYQCNLHEACFNCDSIRVQQLLISANDSEINSKDEKKRTPLHYAIWSKVCMHLLLEHGALIGAKDCNGDTPLHRACQMKRASEMLELVTFGASHVEKNYAGITPIEILEGWSQKALKKLLEIINEDDSAVEIPLSDFGGDSNERQLALRSTIGSYVTRRRKSIAAMKRASTEDSFSSITSSDSDRSSSIDVKSEEWNTISVTGEVSSESTSRDGNDTGTVATEQVIDGEVSRETTPVAVESDSSGASTWQSIEANSDDCTTVHSESESRDSKHSNEVITMTGQYLGSDSGKSARIIVLPCEAVQHESIASVVPQ